MMSEESISRQQEKKLYSDKITKLSKALPLLKGKQAKEMKEYIESLEMLEETGVELRSVRLDKYYSCSAHVDRFEAGTAVFVVPKKTRYSWSPRIFLILQHR